MVFPTSIGPHPSSSKGLRCPGKSGQKVRGSVLEGGMFSTILDPIEEIKFLKVLAISVSFDESCPCMLSSEILLVLFDRPVASLRTAQDFLKSLKVDSLAS